MKLYSLSYLASILFLLFCFLLQLISALQPVLLSTPTPTNVELASKTLSVDLKRRGDPPESPPNGNPNHDFGGRPSPPPSPPLPSPTTNKDDITITEINITLTTIVYTSPYPTIHNASNTGAAHQQQQQPQSTSSVSDPNGGSLKSKLEEDQAALRRMIMILSLVGGLGVIAVVATVVIFTRMRTKNRKQREIEDQGNEGSTYELSGEIDQHSEETSSPPHSTQNIHASSHSDEDNDDDNSSDQHFIEPSAPPALTVISTADISSSSSSNTERRRRHIISMLSQTAAPSPSAPTAKELDAMVDDETSQRPTTSNHHHHHQSHTHPHLPYGSSISHAVCDHCSPLMTPEPPPPAYTPSAPPHYDLPVEPVIADQAIANNEPNSNFLSFPRRHSLGN